MSLRALRARRHLRAARARCPSLGRRREWPDAEQQWARVRARLLTMRLSARPARAPVTRPRAPARLAWRARVTLQREKPAVAVCVQCGARAALCRRLEAAPCRPRALPRALTVALLGGALDETVRAARVPAISCARGAGGPAVGRRRRLRKLAAHAPPRFGAAASAHKNASSPRDQKVCASP